MSPPSRLLRPGKALAGILLITGLTSTGAVAKPRQAGMNTTWTDDFRPPLLADLMQNLGNRRWMTPGGNSSDYALPPGQLDADGWPTVDADIVMWSGTTNNRLGHYTLYFQGQAELARLPSAMQVLSHTYGTNTGQSRVEMNLTNRLSSIFIGFRNTNGGVRDVRLMRPVTDGSAVSHGYDELIDRELAQQFSRMNLIRYMDFSHCNSNPEKTWSDRRRPHTMNNLALTNAYNSNTEKQTGDAWEYIVALANKTQTDTWITLPAMADDAYCRQVAQLFKYGSDGTNAYTSPQLNPVYPPLNTNLTLYVEYGNEVWNSAAEFSQYRYNMAEAEAVLAADIHHPINFDGLIVDLSGFDAKKYDLRKRYSAWRMVRLAEIFQSVFPDEFLTRIRPVFTYQIKTTDGGGPHELGWIQDYYSAAEGKTPNDFFWAAAPALYRSPATNVTLDTLWDSGTMNQADFKATAAYNGRYAAAFGLRMMTYEGGPSFGDPNGADGAHALAGEAIFDPRLYQKMMETLEIFEEAGGDIFVHYNWEPNERFGHLNPLTWADDMPKAQAVYDTPGTSRAALTAGIPAPFTANGATYQYCTPSWKIGSTSEVGTAVLTGGAVPAEYRAYIFRTIAGGPVTAGLDYRSSGPVEFVVFGNGKILGTVTEPAATSGTNTTATWTFDLEPSVLSSVAVLNRGPGNLTIEKVRVGLPSGTYGAWGAAISWNGMDASPGEDPDGDGQSNYEEFIAGTNPADSNSRFEFSQSTDQSLRWSVYSNRLYSVWWSSNLLNGFQRTASNLTGNAFTDTVHQTGRQGFYRITAELSP